MDKLLALGRRVLDGARGLLQGEPLRAIGYGSAVVIYLVANASGRFADLTFEESISAATVATTTLIGVIETARRFVYSPATVAAIVTTPPTAPGPIAAAEEAGVDTGVPAEVVEEALLTGEVIDERDTA